MTGQELGALVAGPASAVVVCVMVLGALYRLVVTVAVPIIQRALDRHLAQVDALLEQQRKESATLTKALAGFERALQSINSRLENLELAAVPKE